MITSADKRLIEQLYDDILIALFQIKDADKLYKILDMVNGPVIDVGEREGI